MGKEMKRIVSWGLIFAIAAAMIGCTTSGGDSMEPTETGEITASTENVVICVPDFGFIEPTAETSEVAEPSAEAAVPSTKATQPGGSDGSTLAATAQATDPKPTEPQPTEPQSKHTESQPTQTQPKPTEPKPTEPAPALHTHSYTKTVIAPACAEQGYTVYQCACGNSYKDDYTSAKGHAWGDWVTTKEASITAEGEQSRSCSVCGVRETKVIPKLEGETIDIAALKQYGINYGVNTYGCIYTPGLRDGYYPGYTSMITSMADGRDKVEGKVDELVRNLLGVGAITQEDIDNKIVGARLDVEVVDESNGFYTIWVYYG